MKMIRAFITTWSLGADGAITHPILEWCEAQPLPRADIPLIDGQIDYAHGHVILDRAHIVVRFYFRPIIGIDPDTQLPILDSPRGVMLTEGVHYAISPDNSTISLLLSPPVDTAERRIVVDNNRGVDAIALKFPDADANGLPDKDRIVVVIRTLNWDTFDFTELSSLPGVKMLPPYRFQKPVSEIPLAVRNAIKDAIVAEGIPISALSGVEVYGDFLKKVVNYLSVHQKGFGKFETDHDGEWA